MISLTIIVLVLAFGWAVKKVWTMAADALARKSVPTQTAQGAALN